MTEELVSSQQRPAGVATFGHPQEDRATIESMFTHYWNEQSLAVYVPDYDPKYYVEGLRRNGSQKGSGAVAWLFGAIFRGIGYLFTDTNRSYSGSPVNGMVTLGNGTVCGANTGTRAVQVAKNTEPGTKWMAWSQNHVALFDFDRSGELGVRWHASTPHLPTYQRKEGKVHLTWSDESYIVFLLPAGEQWRLDALERGDPNWQNINNRYR